MKKRLLNLSDSIAIIKIILLLTLIFGFNDGSEKFVFGNWINNLGITFLLVSFVVLIHVLGLKLAAKYYGTELRIKLWNSHKFKEAKGFAKKMLLIYSTPIINILAMIISNGKFYLSSVMSFDVEKEVLGRKFQYITYFNIALIVFFGLLFNLALMWIFKLAYIDLGIKISFWFILFSLIPLSELPGAKILAGSVPFYVFCVVFFLANIILLYTMNSFLALLISLIFSVTLATLFFIFFQYKKV